MVMTQIEIENAIFDLQKKIDSIKKQGLHQSQIPSGTIKARHIGEGVKAVRTGIVADRPTEGEYDGAIYYASDTKVLYIWSENRSDWDEVALT